MNLQDDLLAMERKLWSGGKAVYERTLDDDCLIAFTEMAGVSSRDSIAQQADANRWHARFAAFKAWDAEHDLRMRRWGALCDCWPRVATIER